MPVFSKYCCEHLKASESEFTELQQNLLTWKESQAGFSLLLNGDVSSLPGPELAIQSSLIACLIVCEITVRLAVAG